MTSVPSRVTAWTLPRAKSGWPAIAFISCSWVAKSSASMLLRADSYRPLSSIASAIPVSCNVTDVLVITEAPSGMCPSTASRAGIEVVDDLDVEAVLLEGDDGVGERLFVGQRHKAFIRPGGGHCWSSLMARVIVSALPNRLLAIRRPAQSRIRTRPASAWWICCIAAAPLRGRRGRSGRTRHPRAEQRVPSRRRRVGGRGSPCEVGRRRSCS